VHELSVAAALLEWAEEQSRVHAPRVLRSIELELDPLSCLNPEALRFGFDALAAETPLAGVLLEMVEVAPTWECRVCGERLAVQSSPLICSRCGAPLPRLSKESSLKVRSIEVEEP
jgi:hydrogenase nickel incorporation protein HypA/HybF